VQKIAAYLLDFRLLKTTKAGFFMFSFIGMNLA